MNQPRRKTPVIDSEELTRHIIVSFRRLSKIAGPHERLQTREFRTACDAIKKIESWIETAISSTMWNSTKELIELLQERYSRETIHNYILYFWPLHLYQGVSLLNELPDVPERVLDIGSGAGSFAMSALLHGASDVTLFDQSRLFLDAAGDLIGRWGYPIHVEEGTWPKKPLPQGPFDLVTIGHAIYEMSNGSHETAIKLIEDALARLNEKGFLVIATSSEEPVNRWFLELRDMVREKGHAIQAPCVWQGHCPAKKHQSSPCYAQRKWEKPTFIKELQRGSGIFLNSLKMSYLIIRSPLMKKLQPAIDPLYRVISPPIDMLGEKRFFLCGTGGKRHIGCRKEFFKDSNAVLPKELRAFQYLERGSLLTFSHIVEKKEAIDLVTDSTLTLVAPADKPMPTIPVETDIVQVVES